MPTDIIALMGNNSYYYSLSQERKENRGGAKSPEDFRNHAFSMLGKCSF